MRRFVPTIALTGLLLLPASPASCWEAETRVRIVDEAVRFMPASLRTALEHNREPLLRGVLTPMTDEGGPAHRPPWVDGTLDRSLVDAVEDLRTRLGRRTPFAELARGFGVAAHYVLDAGFPPGVTDGDGDARYAHFARFCKNRRERFPLVFYGHDDPALARGDYHAFAMEVMERARADDRELSRAYAAAGSPPDPAAFDDRSVPFAVGSLAYSHGVTDVVRLWLRVWQEAGGDMGSTPYLKRDNRSN